MKYNSWLFLQDGNSIGFNISSIGLNLVNNSVEKVITYKSFLKLIPNPAQDINVKSKLKKVLFSICSNCDCDVASAEHFCVGRRRRGGGRGMRSFDWSKSAALEKTLRGHSFRASTY